MYSMEWKYEPGQTNVTDPLSRNPAFMGSSCVVASVTCRVQAAFRRYARFGRRLRCAVLMRKGAHSTGGGVVSFSDGSGLGAASDPGVASTDGFSIWCPEGADWLHAIRTADETDQTLKNGRKRQRAKLQAKEGYWFRGNALYVPEMEREKDRKPKGSILRENHVVPQAGHMGRTKMLEKL